MPKYLIQASYTPEGVKGLQKDGGTRRRSVLAEVIGQLNGKLESFYFAFGETDVYLIAELPSDAAITALSLAVAATGTVHPKTTVLIPPEEMDQAVKQSVRYVPPGGR